MKQTMRTRLAISALMLTGIAVAQTPPPPPADPDISNESARQPKSGMEARMSGVSAGTVVQSPAGESIGLVKDVVPDANSGEPAYVLISTRSGNTAVPYSAITPLFHDGHIILDRSRLESAPRVSDKQLLDSSDVTWKKQADRYWGGRNASGLR
jgi:hypothetical protein